MQHQQKKKSCMLGGKLYLSERVRVCHFLIPQANWGTWLFVYLETRNWCAPLVKYTVFLSFIGATVSVFSEQTTGSPGSLWSSSGPSSLWKRLTSATTTSWTWRPAPSPLCPSRTCECHHSSGCWRRTFDLFNLSNLVQHRNVCIHTVVIVVFL